MAGGVLSRSSTIFLSSFPIFLLLSLLLFSFRSAVHLGTQSLTSFLHHDPSLRSLLSRLHALSPPPRPRLHAHHTIFSDTALHSFYPRRRRSSSSSISSSHPPINSSFLFHLTASDGLLTRADKVRVFNPHPSAPILLAFVNDEDRKSRAKAFGFRLFGQGFDLDRRDAVTLLHLACLFSLAHAYAILGFLLTYSCVFGAVYCATTAWLLRRRRRRRTSAPRFLYWGSKLGLRRLPVLLFLRWSLRDALTQLLCILFFSEIKDQFSLLKLFVKVKLMPFVLTAPPPPVQFARDDVNPNGFLLVWTVLDTAISIVFAMDCWIAIMERNGRRRSGMEVVKEGCHLVSIMMSQAIFIKSLEMLMCGKFGTRMVTAVGGAVFAMVVQSVTEVYFMVVWLMFYFAARSKAGELDSRRRFGWRELEESFNGLS